MSATCISNALKTALIIGANIMNPDESAPKEESDLDPYCL